MKVQLGDKRLRTYAIYGPSKPSLVTKEVRDLLDDTGPSLTQTGVQNILLGVITIRAKMDALTLSCIREYLKRYYLCTAKSERVRISLEVFSET